MNSTILTSMTYSLNSPWPKFEKKNYLPIYSKFCNSFLGLHKMIFFPWDSLEGFLKLPNNYQLLLELIAFSFSFNSKVFHYNLVTFKKNKFHDILSLSIEINLTFQNINKWLGIISIVWCLTFQMSITYVTIQFFWGMQLHFIILFSKTLQLFKKG